MNITNFDISQVRIKPGIYHSDIYGEDFPLVAKTRTYVKLDPLPKEKIRLAIPEFKKRLPGESLNSSALETPEFYTGPRFHQFYKFGSIFQGDVLYVFFRDKSSDKTIDDCLEAMQESAIISQCLGDVSDSRMTPRFRGAYQRALNIGRDFFGKEIQDFQYLGRGKLFEEFLRNRFSMVFDMLSQMESKGHDPEKIMQGIERMKIHPHFRFDGDILFKIAKESLKPNN